MTTVVAKGAGRPAAAKKSARHAQRTPLPPKAAEVAEAPPAAAGTPVAEAGTQYGRMTVAELRARAKVLGVSPLPKTKGGLLSGILAAERTDTDTAVAEQAPQVSEVPRVATAPAVGIEEKGARKAARFAADIALTGWSAGEPEATGEVGQVRIVATRGEEILTIAWDTGVYNYVLSGHVISDRTTKLRNVSHARQVAARSAESATAELARVVSNRSWRPREARTTTAPRKLPFDIVTATDEEITRAVAGKHLVWLNRISNAEEHGIVSPSHRYFRVTGAGAERVLQFNTKGGFRACRLDQILRVGSAPTRKRNVESAEDTSAEPEQQPTETE